MKDSDVKRKKHGWEAVQGAVAGSSHVQQDVACQDKTYIMERNGVLAAALADGAGSASFSHYGAETVVREACRILTEGFERYYNSATPQLLKKTLLEGLLEELGKTAAQHDCNVNELASTLLAVAVKDDSFLIVHLGDGVIGYTKGSDLKVASAPQNGEFANTTYFVTSPQAYEMMRVRKGQSEDINGFLMMSDGSEASLYSRHRNELAPILQRLLYRLGVTSSEYLEPFIEISLADVVSRKTRDDCSLILMSKRLRTYDEMDTEEMDDYFDIHASGKHVALIRRKRYREILDALVYPKTVSEISAAVGIASKRYLEKRWLGTLLDLGYIVKDESGKYRRVVGSGQVEAKDETAEIKDEQEKEMLAEPLAEQAVIDGESEVTDEQGCC